MHALESSPPRMPPLSGEDRHLAALSHVSRTCITPADTPLEENCSLQDCMHSPHMHRPHFIVEVKCNEAPCWIHDGSGAATDTGELRLRALELLDRPLLDGLRSRDGGALALRGLPDFLHLHSELNCIHGGLRAQVIHTRL